MRTTMRLDPNDPRLVTGTVQEQQQARHEYRRQQRIAVARRSGMEEVSRDDLDFGRFYITHLPTGRLYRVSRGEQFMGPYDTATAFYVTADEQIVFLEPPAGPKTVDELAQQRAEREARRNAPKPKPAWMTAKR